MMSWFNTGASRFRLLAILEGLSLIFVILVGIPLKYLGGTHALTAFIIPGHGIVVLLYVLDSFRTAIRHNTPFSVVIWEIVCSCLLPFGAFYLDRIDHYEGARG